jgi:NDP-sugar pyrophosphorylase family protein
MVLAAGRGTRLGSLGRRVPKVLVDLAGRPLLAWQFDYLEREGFRSIVVNAHHLAGEIRSFVDSYRGALELTCVFEPELLGTAGGVRNALAALQPGPFVVLYGDVLTREPLTPLLEAHARSSAVATLAVHESELTEGKGTVAVGPDWRVTRFVEKGPPEPGRVALVNSGIYVLESSLVEELPLGVPLDFGHDVFPQALERGAHIMAHKLSTPVLDMGTPETLALARTLYGGGEAEAR